MTATESIAIDASEHRAHEESFEEPWRYDDAERRMMEDVRRQLYSVSSSCTSNEAS